MTPKESEQNLEETATRSTRQYESLGAQLRRAREAKGLSLRDIAEETRISRRYLEAIEADNYSQLPGGIFNRSFIRAYAKRVGMNEQRAIEDYARELRERGISTDDVPLTIYKPNVYTGDAGNPSLARFLLTLAVAVIVAGGAYLLLQWAKPTSPSPANNATAKPAPTASINVSSVAVSQTNANTTASNVGPTMKPDVLRISIKARGEDLWIRTYTDDGKGAERILKADETEEFTPQRDFKVQFSKSKTNAFEMTINGAPVKAAPVAPNPKSGLLEFNVTKENAAQLIQ